MCSAYTHRCTPDLPPAPPSTLPIDAQDSSSELLLRSLREVAASSTFRSPACGGSLCLRTWRTPWTEIHSTFSSNSIFRAERWMWRKSFFFLIMRICEGGSSWRLLPAQKHQQPGILSFARVYLFSYDILAWGGGGPTSLKLAFI